MKKKQHQTKHKQSQSVQTCPKTYAHAKYFLMAVMLLTLVVFAGVRHFDFTNWDDNFMVYENNQVTSLSKANIGRIFTPTAQMNEYQPLTTLSYALIYRFFGMEPHAYHLASLMLHLLNILLVFMLAGKLTSDFRIRYIIVFLFALHPFQVEAVAWISAHNYVLFTSFFLASCIFYTSYIKSNKYSDLALAFLLFVPAILAKSTAVVLPVVFLSLDYLFKRDFKFKLILEKAPFFVLSLVGGIIAMIPKATSGAFTTANIYSVTDRIFFAPYALFSYILKLIAPLNLRLVYEFPSKEGAFLPLLYYAAALGLIVLVIIIFRFEKWRHYLLFGLLFLTANIFLVLHLIPFNHSGILAERYTYIGSIGVFFALAFAFVKLYKSFPTYKFVFVIVGVLYGSFMVYQTNNRVGVWQNSITLFTDQIQKSPHSYKAYYIRGEAYVKQGRLEEAYADFFTATDINPEFADAFVNKGYVQTQLGHYEAALADYEKALEINPDNYNALTNKGYLLNLLGFFEEARETLNNAILLDSTNYLAYTNLALAFYNQGNYNQSLQNINKALTLNPVSHEAFNNRGMIYENMGRPGDAIADFRNATEINKDFFQAYNNIGKLHFENGQYDSAIVAFTKAIEINKNFSMAFINRGTAYYFKGNITEACRNWREALRTGDEQVNQYILEYCE